jgi:hypothetical protein
MAQINEERQFDMLKNAFLIALSEFYGGS